MGVAEHLLGLVHVLVVVMAGLFVHNVAAVEFLFSDFVTDKEFAVACVGLEFYVIGGKVGDIGAEILCCGNLETRLDGLAGENLVVVDLDLGSGLFRLDCDGDFSGTLNLVSDDTAEIVLSAEGSDGKQQHGGCTYDFLHC